jgi:hypothetical protein
MSQVEIGAKISVDASAAGQTIKDLKDSIKEARTELDNATIGSKQHKDAQDKLSKSQKDLSDATKESGKGFDELKGKISAVSPAAGGAAEAANKFKGVLDILKQHPIIAILAILTAIILGLVSKFKEMDGAADAMSDAWTEISNIFKMFLDNILTPLIDGFVSLIKNITSAVEWIGDKLGVSAKATSQRFGELAKTVRELDDAQKDQALATAAANRKLQEAREIAGDANVPIKERVAALKEAGKIEKEELDKVVALNKAKTAALMEAMALEMHARGEVIAKIKEGSLESLKAAREELLGMKNVNKDRLYELDQMIIAAEDAGAQAAKIAKKTQSQINSLEKQDNAEKESKAKEHKQKLKEINEEAQKKEDARVNNIKAQNKKDEDLEFKARLAAIQDEETKKRLILAENHKKELELEEDNLKKGLITKEQYNNRKKQIDSIYFIESQKIVDDHNKKVEADQKKKDAEDLKKKQDEAKNKIAEGKTKINDSALKISERRAELDAMDKLLKDYKDKGLITEAEYTKGQDDNAKARTAIAKAEADGKAALAESYASALNGLADVVGKQTAIGKGLSVASALISTYEGIAKGVKLGYPMAIPAVISAAATGFGAVRNILATKVPGQGDSGSAPSSKMSAPLLPREAMTTTSLSGRTLTSMNATASRAYVVESDVTNNQTRISRINRAARLA